MDSNLARKLAQSLGLDIARQSEVEAVIQEAVDETLEEAALFADGKHEGIAAAIRSLKIKTTQPAKERG